MKVRFVLKKTIEKGKIGNYRVFEYGEEIYPDEIEGDNLVIVQGCGDKILIPLKLVKILSKKKKQR